MCRSSAGRREDRAITVIEVLSPDNKRAGSARTSYLHQREQFWSRGTNVIEIDLLRAGEPTAARSGRIG